MTRKLTLIERYTILKPKLEREIVRLKELRKLEPSLGLCKIYARQIRLHRRTLELLKDTFSGEEGEIT